MNDLCLKICCPLVVWCDFWGLSNNEADKRLVAENSRLLNENQRNREIMIENGLTYGAGEQRR